ncbi:MAG: alkaline phosphatase family protein [Acidimicrobiales bacterium]
MPEPVAGAVQVVLLVLDGLGWDQLRARSVQAPFLSAMAGGPITSVAPTTTATALTSITTGLPPAGHEILGYRLRVEEKDVLNVLRWRTAAGDARDLVDPELFQRQAAFGGTSPVVVTRAEFGPTGFTIAHLPGVRLDGWRVASSLPVIVGRALRRGEPFVYAYYDGIDKIAHEQGFGDFYDAELRYVDHLVAEVAAQLPAGAVLVITADHGQVEVGDATIVLTEAVLESASLVSGEGRFRWLHAQPGATEALRAAAEAEFGAVAWIRTVDELEADGWFGGPLSDAGRHRLGDVALIPFASVAIVDPADTGEFVLRCRHGSATAAEMYVPLLAHRA